MYIVIIDTIFSLRNTKLPMDVKSDRFPLLHVATTSTKEFHKESYIERYSGTYDQNSYDSIKRAYRPECLRAY